MEIKKLTRDDLGDVVLLYGKMMESLPNKFWYKEMTTEDFQKLIADGCLFGAFLDSGKMIAVSALELDVPNYVVSDEFISPELKLGEVGYFIVDEKYRGQGIINKINLELLKIAKSVGFNALCAGIHPSNISAIKAFSKLGKLEYVGSDRMDRSYPSVVLGVRI